MRVKTLVVPAAVTLVALGGLAATATADPGPNDHNTFGLCTAYFAGSETGQEHKRKAPPFQGLEAAAEAADQTVEEYCAENGTHPGQGGGNGGKKSG
jgi:Spy/CpxP family protein refolding chaperone